MPRLFQDAAGTIPAVLPGQPVGLIQRAAGTVDVLQATAAAKPTLARRPRGGRRNLLVDTATMSSASGWSYTNSVVASTNAPAPDGSATAVKLLDTTSSTSHVLRRLFDWNLDTSCTASVHLKRAEHRYATVLFMLSAAPPQYASLGIDLDDGSVVNFGGQLAAGSSYVIAPVGDGWFRIAITTQYPTPNGTYLDIRMSPTPPTVATGNNYVGDGVSGLYTWGWQAEAGSVATAYQRVVSANDITEAGNNDVWHLLFDGVDDALDVTLPAGTYGRARVSDLGVVTVDSVTNPTSVSWGGAARVADFMLRQEAYSSAEIAALTKYWEGLYK